MSSWAHKKTISVDHKKRHWPETDLKTTAPEARLKTKATYVRPHFLLKRGRLQKVSKRGNVVVSFFRFKRSKGV